MDSRTKSLIVGALVGAALGALGGYLFNRAEEETPVELRAHRSIPAGDLAKLAASTVGLLRGIAEMGQRAR